MLFDLQQFESMLETLNFGHFPRSIGDPRQRILDAHEQAWPFIRKAYGDRSCFISTNGYDSVEFDVGGKRVPRTIIYGLTFFDFDHETKPENAFADAQRLCQYLRELDICHWVQYSGSKGYHVQIVHEQKRFKFRHTDKSSEALKQMVFQVQDHLRQSLGLNTLDTQTMGDPKRLCRIPFTPHVNRHGDKSGRYAILLDSEELDNIDHFEVERRSRLPVFEISEPIGRKLSLPDLVAEIGLKLSAPETMLKPVINSTIEVRSEGSAARYLGSLGYGFCPGVVNELKRRNPPHKARVYSALAAKVLGYSLEEFEEVWVQMGEAVGYVDLHNKETRLYQMSTIFNNPSMTAFPTCTTLKANGCCIGEACPKYLPEAPKVRKVNRKWRRPADGS